MWKGLFFGWIRPDLVARAFPASSSFASQFHSNRVVLSPLNVNADNVPSGRKHVAVVHRSTQVPYRGEPGTLVVSYRVYPTHREGSNNDFGVSTYGYRFQVIATLIATDCHSSPHSGLPRSAGFCH